MAALALSLGIVALPSPASAEGDPVKPAQMESVARPDVARGVIVRAVGIQGVASARAATDAMGMDVAATRAVTAGASLFLFD